jgi:hypothetical protein
MIPPQNGNLTKRRELNFRLLKPIKKERYKPFPKKGNGREFVKELREEEPKGLLPKRKVEGV